MMINNKDYKKIVKIKGIYRIKIKGYNGLLKYKYIFLKYKILFLCFIIGFLLLFYLSNIIFDIEVVGDNNNLNYLIKNELSNYNIEKYKFKKSEKYIEIVKNKIINKYKNNIEWIEIRRVGVKYIISFVERKVDDKHINNEIYSIVATKSGVIRNIDVDKGITTVEKGDYVSKGDILISSDIVLNDEIKDRVSANGNIYAETWYKVKVSYPLNYNQKIYTKKNKKTLFFRIGNKYYDLFKYDNFTRKNVISIKNNVSNIEFGIENLNEIKTINSKYSNNKAIKRAIKLAKDKIKNNLDDNEYIISEKTLNFSSNGSKIEVYIFFSVYEEIGEKKKIEVGEAYDTENS